MRKSKSNTKLNTVQKILRKSYWGRTDLGQPVSSSYIEEAKPTDYIQTNSN
jgi:hypothetical protein